MSDAPPVQVHEEIPAQPLPDSAPTMTDVFPVSDTEAHPSPKESDPPSPNKDWSFQQLENYIRERFRAGEECDAESIRLGKKSAIEVWYAGLALDLIREKRTTIGAWTQWVEDHELNVDTCYQAIRLYQRVEDVAVLRNMTLAEARKRWKTGRGRLWGAPPTSQGDQHEGQKPIRTTPKIQYKESEPLKRLRGEFEKINEAVGNIADPEWRNADPEIYISEIDGVIEKLKQARRAIRESERTARAELKQKPKVAANGTAKPRPMLSKGKVAAKVSS